MDLLTFIATMTGHLAWPACVLWALFLLRKPIVGLIPDLQKLKYKDLELDFSRKLEDTKKDLEQLPIPPVGLESALPAPVIEFEPGAAPRIIVLEAYNALEREMYGFADDAGATIPDDMRRKHDPVYIVRSNDLIDANTARALQDLRQLRNKAAHYGGDSISEAEANEYAKAARKVLDVLRAIRSWMTRGNGQ